MQKINVPYVALIALVIVSIFSFKAGHETLLEQGQIDVMIKNIEIAKSNTLEIINAMPSEDFDYQPNQQMKSFLYETQLLIDHLDRTTKSINSSHMTETRLNQYEKDGIVSDIEDSFHELLQSYREAPNKDMEVLLNEFLVDNARQVSRMRVYLILKGIETETI